MLTAQNLLSNADSLSVISLSPHVQSEVEPLENSNHVRTLDSLPPVGDDALEVASQLISARIIGAEAVRGATAGEHLDEAKRRGGLAGTKLPIDNGRGPHAPQVALRWPCLS